MIRPSHTILGRALKAARDQRDLRLIELNSEEAVVQVLKTRLAEFDAEIEDIERAMTEVGENI